MLSAWRLPCKQASEHSVRGLSVNARLYRAKTRGVEGAVPFRVTVRRPAEPRVPYVVPMADVRIEVSQELVHRGFTEA